MNDFSLLIKPSSADCNLRCRYCFYLGKSELYQGNSRHRMSDLVLRKVISSFLATEQNAYSFGWQGGEPTLMGLDFFKKVTKYQMEYGRPGVTIANGLQTNGTLLDDEWAEHLFKYKFLVGVSVDGSAVVHDRFRINNDGRGSHSEVMNGISVLRRNNIEFNVLTLVSQSNVHKPKDIFHYLCDMGIRFHQYIECVEFDKNGKLLPFAINGEEWGAFLCAIFDEWMQNDPRKVSVRLFDNILAKMVDNAETTCTIGTDCRHYLVVEHNGDIYPCDFFVEPDLKLGNIMEHTWDALRGSKLYEQFGKRKSQWNEQCDRCEYLQLCAGCCPKNRETRGADPSRLSLLCSGWKMFYKHALPGLSDIADDIRCDREVAARMQREVIVNNQQSVARKVGRNDLCPCGSGKKYKKCCGRLI